MPRIISGQLKGLKLVSPAGRSIRPTTGQMKEAIFSILVSFPFDFTGARVLDCFAGSGAMGLEAISRGATRAVFVDHDRSAQAAVSRNVEAAKVEASTTLVRGSWPQALGRFLAGEPFDLFFFDPPYEQTALPLTILKEVAIRSLAKPGALAVWEQAKSTPATWEQTDISPWELVKIRQWSTRAVSFLLYNPRPKESV